VIKLATDQKKIGFVWGMHDESKYFDTLEKKELDNLLLRRWVPQRALLSHEKVSLLIS